MKKIVLILIAVLTVLLLSGCGSEESKAAQEFKNTAKENLTLLQSDKSNVEIARKLAENAYNVTCKTYKVQEPLEAEEEKLIAELNLAKMNAVLGYVDRGVENIFSLADKKSGDKAKKEMEPAIKKINEWKEKHKEFIQAVTEYKNSVNKVIDLSYSRRNEDYFINTNLTGEASKLAKSNNYKNLDFSDLDMERFLIPNTKKLEEKQLAKEMREAEEARKAEEKKRAESVLMGEIKDKRAELVTTPDANCKIIRRLNVGEKFIVMDDYTGGPNIKIKMLDTGEEGWAWHSYLKYDYVKKEAVPQMAQNSNQPSSSSSNIIISKAFHTSALKDGDVVYSAQNSIDGDTKTCWAEGVPGHGINEGVFYQFADLYTINGFNIWNGYQKSEDLYYKNSRPVALKVSAVGYEEIHYLKDSMGMQRIDLKKPVKIREIQLSIVEVAKGSKFDDTCISEISFY